MAYEVPLHAEHLELDHLADEPSASTAYDASEPLEFDDQPAPDPHDTARNQLIWEQFKKEHPDILGTALLQHGKKIGAGKFGTVYRALIQSDSNGELHVAIKALKNLTFEDIGALSKEALYMKTLKHENVLGLICVAHDRYYRPVLISHFMELGDLLSLLHDRERRFNVGNLLEFGRQIAKGMEYLHVEAKMVHRDLAARNCMCTRVSSQLIIKVADFGLSRHLGEGGVYTMLTKDTPLPFKWSAPEIRTHGKFSQKTDVWSFGVVLFEITTLGSEPYHEIQFDHVLEIQRLLAIQQLFARLAVGERLGKPLSCPDALYDIMLNCWSKEAQDRRDFAEIRAALATVTCECEKTAEVLAVATSSAPSLSKTAQQVNNDTNRHTALLSERRTISIEGLNAYLGDFKDNVHVDGLNALRSAELLPMPIGQPDQQIELTASKTPTRFQDRCIRRKRFLAATISVGICILVVSIISWLTARLLTTTTASNTTSTTSTSTTTPTITLTTSTSTTTPTTTSRRNTSAEDYSAATRTGRAFIIGGHSLGIFFLASVEIFDSRRSLFLSEETATNLSSARGWLGAAAVGNYVYAIGGQDATVYLARTERLDVANPQSTWQTRAAMQTARIRLAVASSSTTIFAIGGWDGSHLNTLEAFDATTQRWNANLRGMPTARWGLVAGVIGDFLYAAGGYNGQRLNVVEKYQISTNEWSTVAPMHFNRSDACAAVLDNKFHVIGGLDDSAGAEVYTPSTNTWSRIADMSTRRTGCGAAALGGLIYVFGGHAGNDFLDSVEVYNMTTDSWHTLPAKMKIARNYFGIATILDE